MGYTVKEGHIQDGSLIEAPKGKKSRYMHTRAKYRGLKKNAAHWFLICGIYNFELLARRYA